MPTAALFNVINEQDYLDVKQYMYIKTQDKL